MGYSQAELAAVQARWDLRFPPDLIELLREHQPFERGNPIFSVYQIDVICYDADLADWIERERDRWPARPLRPIKEIRLWSEALRKNGAEPVPDGR